ncbi:MAG: hypothetical protein CSB55_03555 [Candidatus Cloacimonadota bacterium]|nr:MAG: hypothetical protein CSB55_03555 [Candidatus Cloacimonadota bacterium]
MKNKCLLFIIAVLAFAGLNAELIINHNVPQNSGKDKIDLTFNIIDGFDTISEAKVFYRYGNDEQYLEYELENSEIKQNGISVSLDLDASKHLIQYYLQVKLNDGSVRTAPEVAPQLSPFTFNIAPEEDYSDGFILLSPNENDVIESGDITFVVSFLPVADEIAENSVEVNLNGVKIVENVEVYTNVAVVKISDYKLKSINLKVFAKTKDGKELQSKSWFVAVKQNKLNFDLPFNTVGSLKAGGYYKNIDYSNLEEKNKTRKVAYSNLGFNGKYKWLKFKSSLYLTSRESSKRQVLNKYRLQLEVPHAVLNVGDYSPNLGNFIINSKNIRGFHTALNWEYFRMQAVYGRSKREIDGSSYVDSVVVKYGGGQFRRNTFGIRTEFGNENTLNFGIGIAKNKDCVSSLDEKYVINEKGQYIAKAKDNFVTGFDFQWAMFDRRLVVGAESAFSMYNNDINDGVITQDSLETFIDDDIPFNPSDWEDVFVINKNLVPILPNTSNFAYKAYLNSLFWGNYLTFSFTEVGGSFKSLSSTSFPQDTRTFSISDNLNLLDNKLTLSGGANIISDNVNDHKEITTASSNWYISAMYSPFRNVFFRTGYSDSRSEGTKDKVAESDTTDVIHDNTNSDINFTAGYFADMITKAPTRFTLSCGFNNYEDNMLKHENDRGTYTLGATSYFVDYPVVSTFQYTFGHSDYSSYNDFSNGYSSFYAKLDFSFMENKIKPFTSYRYTLFGGEEEDGSRSKVDIDKATYDYGLGVKWKVLTDTELSSRFNVYGYADEENDAGDYSRFKISFDIKQRF